MSLSKKAAVVLFIVCLSLSVFVAPSHPVTTETASSPSLSPATQKEINQWYDTVSQPGFTPNIDSVLSGWLETGVVTDAMVHTSNGVSAMVVVTPSANLNAIRQVVHIDQFVNMVYFKTLKVTISSPAALSELAKIPGVGIINSDTYRTPTVDDLVKQKIDVAPPTEAGVDTAVSRQIVGATDALSYDGTGITVGQVDTGADFGNPALQAAYDTGSYDPTGEGLVPMWYYANSTDVSNITDWVDVQGNLLTYVMGGDVYLNVTGWDPLLNNIGGGRYLYGDGYYDTDGSIVPYVDRVGFIWLYAWAWGVDINATWLDTTKQDWKLPATSNLEAGTPYQVNWIFQQRNSPYAKLFAPALVYNGTDKGFHMVVNWEDTNAWNLLWTGGFYYGTYNLTNAADLATIYGKFDWDFTNDFGNGEIYDLTNPIVAHDYTGDGIDDFSLGALSWCYDAFGFGTDPMFHGFSKSGDFCLYWDSGTHGTATAALVAARRGYNFVDPNSGAVLNMTGIAPGAKIISVRALSDSADYFSYVWCAGFDMTNETSGEFTYTGNHMADVVTNSWGWVIDPSGQMNYLDFTWEILSTPGILAGGYPGVLHVFSAGNEGAGYMTIGPPGSATGVLTVGASTESAWLEYLYGPTQPYEGIASFTSRGPSFTGYPKPDVLAPGLADYSLTPWYSMFYATEWHYVSSVNVTLFSGTSMSAPIAAGVVAIVEQALAAHSVTENPFLVKEIIQSTAKDFGYDPATQGFGRIDAVAACAFVDSGGYIGSTLDSAMNFAKIIGDAWAYYGVLPGSYEPVDVNSSAVAFPSTNPDGAIYFGEVYPGQTVTTTYSIYTDTATWPGTPDTSDYTGSNAYIYTKAATYTFSNTTFSYNDTANMVDEQMYGYYDLNWELGSTDYSAMMGADMITICVGFNGASVAGNEPWMFLYDWQDNSPHDFMPNLYNATKSAGDELHRITSAADESNVNTMTWAPESLSGHLTLVIHDPIHDVNQTAMGHTFNVTIIAWNQVADSNIAFAGPGTATGSVNVTLTAPSDAGIHAGFVDFAGTGLRVPYSYMVVANLTQSAGAKNTIFADSGVALEPYDNAMYGNMQEDPDAWDFRSYVVYNPYDTATYLGVRAVWPTTGNNMYVSILNTKNAELASNEGETATTTAVLAKIPGKGYYYILVHPTELNGTAPLPSNFTLEAMVYDSLTNQPVVLSYTSDDRAGATPVADGDTVWGDHAVLNASYPAFNLPNMPEFEITSTRVGFLAGVYYQHTGNEVVPSSSYNPYTGAPLDLTQFAFEYVSGIKTGDTVSVTCSFTNGDTDIFAYWASSDNSTWTYANDLMGNDMATSANPEAATFTAGQSGTLVFAIFDYSVDTGQYTLTVDTRVGVYKTKTGPEVTYDTYNLGKNGTYAVQVFATTGTNLDFTVEYSNITFDNYFKPYMHTVTASGTGAVKTITWTYSDLNAQDNHTFQVYISGDDGETYQLIATGVTATSYQWDSTGFTQKNYKAMIRVTDSYGLTDQMESASFAAGTVVVTSSTSSLPPTTTTPTGVDTTYLLWIGLIGGIGVGVVVVLILFLVKRK